MSRLVYAVKRIIFSFLATIKWTGWKHPLWIMIGSSTFKLKGKQYREVKRLIRPGDILVRRFDNYLNNSLIPGWWKHASIYVGQIWKTDSPCEVIHAIGEGVVSTDLIDFMRADHLLVLRLEEDGHSWVQYAIDTAKALLGREYDFEFDFRDPLRYCCTELVMKCYPNLIKGKQRWGRLTVIADDIVAATESEQRIDRLRIVWDSRKG